MPINVLLKEIYIFSAKPSVNDVTVIDSAFDEWANNKG